MSLGILRAADGSLVQQIGSVNQMFDGPDRPKKKTITLEGTYFFTWLCLEAGVFCAYLDLLNGLQRHVEEKIVSF